MAMYVDPVATAPGFEFVFGNYPATCGEEVSTGRGGGSKVSRRLDSRSRDGREINDAVLGPEAIHVAVQFF